MAKKLKQPPAPLPPAPVVCMACRNSTGEGCDDFEYSVLQLTLASTLSLIEQIGVAAVFASGDETFYRVVYFDYAVQYVGDLILPLECLPDLTVEQQQKLIDDIDSYEWVQYPDVPLHKVGRASASTREIGVDDVIWKTFIDNDETNVQIETQRMTKTQLVEIARQLMKMKTTEQVSPVVGRPLRAIQL